MKKLPIICALVFLVLAACQGGYSFRTDAIAIYATQSEAQSVAHGHFGAVPVALIGDEDIECVAQNFVDTIEVMAHRGIRGWVPSQAVRQETTDKACPSPAAVKY